MNGVFYMWKKKNQPARLGKKISKRERIKKWFQKHKMPFVIAGIFLALIVFAILIFIFAPGTESGNWYNGFKGVI